MQRKESIWLVDDDPTVIDVIKRAFAKEHLTCELASFSSGNELSTQLNQGGYMPALLVVDYYLIGEDGLTIVERLQKNSQTSAIKTVLFSQSLKPEIIYKAQELGVYQVLTKPVSFEQWRELAKDLCLAGYFL